MGVVMEINKAANEKLKQQFFEAGIDECEVKIPGKCWRNNALSFAHKHKRIWYRACPELLSSMSEVILACTPCHQVLEVNEKLTLQVFKRLRPKTTTMPKPSRYEEKKPTFGKKPKDRTKKADWMRPHKCIHCHRVLTGLLCSCGELSTK